MALTTRNIHGTHSTKGNTGRLAACWAVATAGLLPPCRAPDGTTEEVVIWTMAMKDREEMREKENQPNTKKG
jgi:hypothetical protein